MKVSCYSGYKVGGVGIVQLSCIKRHIFHSVETFSTSI